MAKKFIGILLFLCLMILVLPAYAAETEVQKSNREVLDALTKKDGFRLLSSDGLKNLLRLEESFVLVVYSSECGMPKLSYLEHFMDLYDLKVHYFDVHTNAIPSIFWSIFKDDSDPGYRYPLLMTYDGKKVESVDVTLFNGKTNNDQYRLMVSYLKATRNIDLITDFDIYNKAIKSLERQDMFAFAAYLMGSKRYPTRDSRVVNFANSLTQGLSSDEEKAQKIFLWTSSKIMNSIAEIQAIYRENPNYKVPTNDTAVDVISNTIYSNYYYAHDLMIALLRSIGLPTKMVRYSIYREASFYDLFNYQAEYLKQSNLKQLAESFEKHSDGIISQRILISSYINGRWVLMSPDVDTNSLLKAGGNLPPKAATLDGYDLNLSSLSQHYVFNDFEDEESINSFEVLYRNVFDKLKMKIPFEAYVHVKINGKHMTFSDAWPFIDENGITQVPVNSVLTAYGARVTWHDKKKEIVVQKDSTTVIIPLGQKNIYKNGSPITIGTSARVIGGRTFLPIASVITALGGKASWDSSQRTVVID